RRPSSSPPSCTTTPVETGAPLAFSTCPATLNQLQPASGWKARLEIATGLPTSTVKRSSEEGVMVGSRGRMVGSGSRDIAVAVGSGVGVMVGVKEGRGVQVGGRITRAVGVGVWVGGACVGGGKRLK